MREFDDEHTVVDSRKTARSAANAVPPSAPPSRPAKLPAFVPAETVVPMVSYRDNGRPQRASEPPPRRPSEPRVATPAPQLVPVAAEPSVMERMPHATPAPAPLPQTTSRGALTVVFGCRGGSGATTLAINTAAQLVRAGRSVCLVDLDLHLGDVFVALDLEAQTSLASVAREAGALDAPSLRRRVAQHASGICALTQVGYTDDLDATLPQRLPALLDTLRAHFDHVIVDGVRDFGDVALPALEAATQVLVVVTQDVPSVRRAARVLGILRRLGLDDRRSRLVVNRAVRGAAIDDGAIERALSLRIAARVREDARVAAALDDGVLLLDIARTRPIAADLAGVAGLVSGAPAPAPRTLFGLLGGRR